MRPWLEDPTGRKDKMADRTHQVFPGPLRGQLLYVELGEFLVEGDKERKREDACGFLAREPIKQYCRSKRWGRDEPMARVITLAASKERIASDVAAGQAYRSYGASLNFADERAAKGQTETFMRKQNGRRAPRAIKAAVRNFSFDRD